MNATTTEIESIRRALAEYRAARDAYKAVHESLDDLPGDPTPAWEKQADAAWEPFTAARLRLGGLVGAYHDEDPSGVVPRPIVAAVDGALVVIAGRFDDPRTLDVLVIEPGDVLEI